MEVTLSWDLLVILFFAIVIAYSFIVGKDESVKIIVASYISIVAIQGIGNLIGMLFGGTTALGEMLGVESGANVVATIKLILFIAMIIFLAVKGGFEIRYDKDISGVWEPVLTGAFGIATAGLLLTALLTFIAARPLLDTELAHAPLLSSILSQSPLAQFMVDYQDVWFCLPAILLVGIGFFGNRESE